MPACLGLSANYRTSACLRGASAYTAARSHLSVCCEEPRRAQGGANGPGISSAPRRPRVSCAPEGAGGSAMAAGPGLREVAGGARGPSLRPPGVRRGSGLAAAARRRFASPPPNARFGACGEINGASRLVFPGVSHPLVPRRSCGCEGTRATSAVCFLGGNTERRDGRQGALPADWQPVHSGHFSEDLALSNCTFTIILAFSWVC